MKVAWFPREHFLERRWVYRKGQHVTIVAPTDWGKTTFAYQLLQYAASPELPAVTFVMKPRDETVDKWNATLGYRKVETWPPSKLTFQPQKPPGFALWPRHGLKDVNVDNARMYREFKKALYDSYAKGNKIVFADEVAGLAELWDLDRVLSAIWMRGRSMGCGLWAASQRPAHVPLHAYSQSAHLFLGRDPDRRARQRYAEIGGIDPKLVEEVTQSLPKYHWLYIRREDQTLCVVEA